MYSVVVPTMWKGKEFERMLPRLCDHTLIDEIIIINNDKANTPEWFNRCQWNNIVQIRPPSNVGVNPAWNYGVELAQNDMICLLSDDVDFSTDVFDFLSDKLGPNDSCVGPYPKPQTVDSSGIKIQNAVDYEPMLCGYGAMMFLNKHNYIPIPEMFKIFMGDAWIYETHRYKGLLPRYLFNFPIKSSLTTTSSQFLDHMRKEMEFLRQLWQYTQHGWTPPPTKP